MVGSMTAFRRTSRHPEGCFRHPVTGALVRYNDNQDAEMVNWAAQVLSGVSTPVTRRLIEMNHQSIQNRVRIQRRTLGEDVREETKVEFRDLWAQAQEPASVRGER